MTETHRAGAAGVVLLSLALAGCGGANSDMEWKQTADGRAASGGGIPIPLLLQGQDTKLKISFPKTDQKVEPGQFAHGEVCYLKVGDVRIDCYADGSTLNLGLNDTSDLLTDNPMWNIEPASGDKQAIQTMRVYAVLFLVAGTVDRLPGGLADYVQSPAQHLSEAVELARELLDQPRVELQGYARGGNFVVAVELTDAGKDKLTDALDEAGEPIGKTQLVRARWWRHRPHHPPRPRGG